MCLVRGSGWLSGQRGSLLFSEGAPNFGGSPIFQRGLSLFLKWETPSPPPIQLLSKKKLNQDKNLNMSQTAFCEARSTACDVVTLIGETFGLYPRSRPRGALCYRCHKI